MSEIVYYTNISQNLPQMRELQSRLGGTIITKRKNIVGAATQELEQLPIRPLRKWLGRFDSGGKLLRNSKAIVSGSPYRDFLSPLPQRKYMIFHGTYGALSKYAIDRLDHFDHFFVIGSRMENMLLRYAPKANYSLVGYLPFTDFSKLTAEQRASRLQGLGLNPQQKTILYTPGRFHQGSWGACAEAIASGIPSEYNLIIRPHPGSVTKHSKEDYKSFQKIAAILHNRRNAQLDTSIFSLADMLSVTDLLISDGNSPAEEGLYFDMPQLIIESESYSRSARKKLWEETGIHQEDQQGLLDLYHCGQCVQEADFATIDWAKQVEQAIASSDDFQEARKAYFNSVFGGSHLDTPALICEKISSDLQ